jgi:hypothetical protein
MRLFPSAARNPVATIEAVIGIATIIAGLYVLSPLLDISVADNGPTPFVKALASGVGLVLFGVAYTASGFMMLLGLFKKDMRLRTSGLFLNGLTRMYVTIVTLLVQGPLPLSWISNFLVGLVVFILWWHHKKRQVSS